MGGRTGYSTTITITLYVRNGPGWENRGAARRRIRQPVPEKRQHHASQSGVGEGFGMPRHQEISILFSRDLRQSFNSESPRACRQLRQGVDL